MTRSRHRQCVLSLVPLEVRLLLTAAPAPTVTWIGQDGHDYAGGATAMAGNGVQDIHLALSGLPANNPISTIEILGYGGGGWVVNIGGYAAYDGVLFQSPGATTADVYVDPYQTETGRSFTMTITYADQTTSVVTFQGGIANPNLFMPADMATASWIGQDGHDLTGPNPGVGPDGIQDVHVVLNNLFPGSAVAEVAVTDPRGDAWESGTNPNDDDRAEFVPNAANAAEGDLYFSAVGDLYGEVLTITTTYADGKSSQTTVTAGHTNPALAMPPPSPISPNWTTLSVQWLGQDGFVLLGQGDVHLTLAGIPEGRSVVTATLSDQSGQDWTYDAPGSGLAPADPSAMALGFKARTNPTTADLAFQPVVAETGATLTLVVTLDNGTVLAAHLAGGGCDPGLRAPAPAATSVVALPGDDLDALANSYGTVLLTPGLYELSQPLVLNNPVTITAEPGAVLLFAQPANAPAWDTAIKVRASHTTLNGFAVRFAGPVVWNQNTNYGPAVVGWSDNFDPWSGDPGVDLTFTNLDIQAPPASTSWEEAPHTFRLVGAESGVVSDNRIKGGITELAGGPWQVTDNDYLGTLPDTYAMAAFATHYTRDLTLSGNIVEPSGPSGKTWRFLALTQEGVNDVIDDNTVVGVGPMDSDTVPNPNASEVILTEAYTVHYEGMVSSVSADGLTLQIPNPQGTPARTGDVVAILSGPQAGQWRTIAQVVNANTYVLTSPIGPGSFAVSLDTGFVDETFEGNTVNAAGSSTAGDMVLDGNQFGVNVLDNTFIGGAYGFMLNAAPSETPVTWGWTHAPFLGATIEGNTVENTVDGGVIDVDHNAYTTTNSGRVYVSGVFDDNLGVWTTAYLDARASAGETAAPALVTVGAPLSVDPGEIVLSASGNQVEGPASVVAGQTFQVVSATLNGEAATATGFVLPAVGTTSPSPSPLTRSAVAPSVTTPTQALIPAVSIAPMIVSQESITSISIAPKTAASPAPAAPIVPAASTTVKISTVQAMSLAVPTVAPPPRSTPMRAALRTEVSWLGNRTNLAQGGVSALLPATAPATAPIAEPSARGTSLAVRLEVAIAHPIGPQWRRSRPSDVGSPRAVDASWKRRGLVSVR